LASAGINRVFGGQPVKPYKVVLTSSDSAIVESLLNEQSGQGYTLVSIAVLPSGTLLVALKADGFAYRLAELAEAEASKPKGKS
jgi:hypothetical protein